MCDEFEQKIYELQNFVVENVLLTEVLYGYCNNELTTSDKMINVITMLEIILERNKRIQETAEYCLRFFV